jgi:hypothetical protein
MLCGNFILSKTANYVSFYLFFNLRNLLYLINWYAYVGNNPINKIDPTGLADIDPAEGPGEATAATLKLSTSQSPVVTKPKITPPKQVGPSLPENTQTPVLDAISIPSPQPGPPKRDEDFQYNSYVLYDSSAFIWTSLRGRSEQVAEAFRTLDDVKDIKIIDTVNWTDEDFISWWNDLPEFETEAVLIYTHAGTNVLQISKERNTGPTTERLESGNMSNLVPKKISYMFLFGCNNADQHASEKNISQKLEEFLLSGSNIVGVDGTLMNYIKQNTINN